MVSIGRLPDKDRRRVRMKLHKERDIKKKNQRLHRVEEKERWRYRESDYIDEE